MEIDIEKEYSQMKNKYINGSKKSTSCKDVLQYMVDNYAEKRWFWAWEVIGKTNSKGGYLSHKSSARLSDLALHTGLVEDRKIGRFKVYRVRKEKREEVLNYLK